MSEEGIAEQLTLTKGRSRALRTLVDGTGDQLLARPGFTGNQDCRICRSYFSRTFQDDLQEGEVPTTSSNIEVFPTSSRKTIFSL